MNYVFSLESMKTNMEILRVILLFVAFLRSHQKNAKAAVSPGSCRCPQGSNRAAGSRSTWVQPGRASQVGETQHSRLIASLSHRSTAVCEELTDKK